MRTRLLLNYLGQLRIYSFVDLLLLLMVSGASGFTMYWAACTHISFLLFLESQHKHRGRAPVREDGAIALMLLAVYELSKLTLGEGMLGGNLTYAYIFFSAIYAMKNKKYWGLLSPIARGAQTAIMVGFFISPLSWPFALSVLAMVIRNLLGDFRDIQQDRRERMHTWPIVWGIKRDYLFLHLFALLGTTWLWWSFANTRFSIAWPIVFSAVELCTYYLTPRWSNKKAVAKLRSLARRLGIVK